MRSAITIGLIALLFSAAGSRAFAAVPAMQHLTIRIKDKSLPPQSFAAQPKEYWRVNGEHARILEGLDVPHNLRKLVICNPPDYYEINLETRKGEHVIMDKKTPVHLPIFTGHNPSAMKLRDLEYGNELEYFTSHNAKKTSQTGKSGTIDQYELDIDDVSVILTVQPKKKKPLTLSLCLKKTNESVTFEYLNYESLPFDEKVFQPPKNVTLTDMREQQFKQEQAAKVSRAIENKKRMMLGQPR